MTRSAFDHVGLGLWPTVFSLTIFDLQVQWSPIR